MSAYDLDVSFHYHDPIELEKIHLLIRHSGSLPHRGVPTPPKLAIMAGDATSCRTGSYGIGRRRVER